MPAQLSAQHLFMRRCALTPLALLVTVCLFLWFVSPVLFAQGVYLITSQMCGAYPIAGTVVHS